MIDNDFEKNLLISYHKAFMDEEAIDKAGINSVVSLLERIQESNDVTSLIADIWKATGSSPPHRLG